MDCDKVSSEDSVSDANCSVRSCEVISKEGAAKVGVDGVTRGLDGEEFKDEKISILIFLDMFGAAGREKTVGAETKPTLPVEIFLGSSDSFLTCNISLRQ